MSQPAQPVLTVRSGRSERNFAVGRDVVVGSDLRADLRVAHPLIARAHLLLRFDHGRWVAVDNNSLNGVFLNGQRVPRVDIKDGQTINIGKPDGPWVTFEVGHHRGSVGLPPPTEKIPAIAPSSGPLPVRSPPLIHRLQTGGPLRQSPPPANAPPRVHRPGDPRRSSSIPIRSQPQSDSSTPTQLGVTGEVAEFPTTRSKPLGPQSDGRASTSGTAWIGRSLENDIVIHDVLASRHHAFLTPTPLGTEIRDAQSINGTFVNGNRVRSALLCEGDVVTIGNADLVFTGGILVRRQEVATRTGGLEVRDVDFSINGKNLLERVSLTARPGTLTAIIGGSGAGKTTLARLIAGYATPTSGLVTFEGHDLHTGYASLRTRIGMVPQDDVVHRQLTVEQALGYAAELRLPPDTSIKDRRQVVERVLDELELTPHKKTRVDKLSGGQRKRASVAMELLTGPSLLILDEPTSGLDPALDRQVMTMLRRLADAGRVVIVVTHSLTYVSMCDQLLLLAPGGKTAFADPPSQIGAAMGSTDWADIFARVSTDPDGVHRAFLARHPAAPRRPSPTTGAAPLGKPPRTSRWRQVGTLARRQARLITADRGYFAFLALLPFVLGVLSLAVPGNTGLGNANSTAPEEPIDILILLNIGAVFMGTALTVRDLVGEWMIFQRERAVGLSASAYLMSKVLVFSAAALIETAVMVVIMTIGKGAPSHGGVVLGHSVAAGVVELWLALALTAITSAMLGLALSSLARSTEQVLPMLVVVIMISMVMAGGLIPVTGRLVLDQTSWLVPARWGFAAAASTVDLNNIEAGLPVDRLWRHMRSPWLLDMGMLLVLAVVFIGIVRFRLRLRARS